MLAAGAVVEGIEMSDVYEMVMYSKAKVNIELAMGCVSIIKSQESLMQRGWMVSVTQDVRRDRTLALTLIRSICLITTHF